MTKPTAHRVDGLEYTPEIAEELVVKVASRETDVASSGGYIVYRGPTDQIYLAEVVGRISDSRVLRGDE